VGGRIERGQAPESYESDEGAGGKTLPPVALRVREGFFGPAREVFFTREARRHGENLKTVKNRQEKASSRDSVFSVSVPLR
jgi:hypothetical protein